MDGSENHQGRPDKQEAPMLDDEQEGSRCGDR
jgi:hypothetical protein